MEGTERSQCPEAQPLLHPAAIPARGRHVLGTGDGPLSPGSASHLFLPSALSQSHWGLYSQGLALPPKSLGPCPRLWEVTSEHSAFTQGPWVCAVPVGPCRGCRLRSASWAVSPDGDAIKTPAPRLRRASLVVALCVCCRASFWENRARSSQPHGETTPGSSCLVSVDPAPAPRTSSLC